MTQQGGTGTEDLDALSSRELHDRAVRFRDGDESRRIRPAQLAEGDAMRHDGVLVGRTGPRGDTLKIRPPLVFAEPHVDRLIAAFERALAETDSMSVESPR